MRLNLLYKVKPNYLALSHLMACVNELTYSLKENRAKMKFTEKEKDYLISATENRMRILRKEIGHENELLYDKHYQKVKFIIDRIKFNEPILGIYKSILTGIVRENYYYEVEDRKEFYFNKSDLEILNISEKEDSEIEVITEIEVLLNKLLPRDKKEALLGDYLKPYKELKKLPFEKSFYSLSGEKIYKIGIPIDKKYLINIELDHDYKMFPFSKNEILNWKRMFLSMGTNKDIVNLFNDYGKENKLTTRMEFVREILKKRNS